MGLMVSEIYDALKSAGASDESSRKAAEVLANHSDRFGKLEADVGVLKALVGVNVALTVAILVKVVLS